MTGPVAVVARGTHGYPPLLAETPGAPAELFVAGLPLEPAPYVAVVGTRRASRYGLEVAGWIAGELAAAGVVVVSGMAVGIDAAAHRGALRLPGQGRTVAVLGSGVDVCYPRANAALHREIAGRGSVVSEYPPGTAPAPWRFPARNRIIAGLALGVVIVEARRDGGAMITARLAAECGREVFAVPGAVHAPGAEGPHALVRDGARLVTSAQASLLTPDPAALSPDERVVLGVLQAEPLVLDRIARLVGVPASAATAVLSRLELSGLATRHPGGRFARTVGRCS